MAFTTSKNSCFKDISKINLADLGTREKVLGLLDVWNFVGVDSSKKFFRNLNHCTKRSKNLWDLQSLGFTNFSLS